MTPPYLTPRGIALLPAMAEKVRDGLKDALGPGCDLSRIPGAKTDAFAAKLLGCALCPRFDPDDSALRDVFAAMETGALSTAEMRLFEFELPRMTGLARRVTRPRDASLLSPSDIHAVLFASFFNGRAEEGTMGENLHIGVRRVFERFFKLFDGLQSIANRAGIYEPRDLFEPAYRTRGDLSRQGPSGPGERLLR